MKKIRTRFAPSPTGYLHVGGLRTALYAYLLAKSNDGEFFIRIEDTDRTRLVEGSLKNILDSFVWSHILLKEGVILDHDEVAQRGNKGPYIQSERLEMYQQYIQELLENEHAYYCFCTKERLDDMRAFQEKNKLPTGYDGHCRNLSKDIVTEKLQSNEQCVIRMKMPQEGTTSIEDMVRGHVEFQNKLIDDQVLIKADGFPTYHFAVVVDDHLMEVTHVVRGEEWLSSTPKHVVLYRMFGWEPPVFAHLSLLVNDQKQKLSKRHGDVSINDFREKGYLPEALVNFIAFLGWNPGTDKEIFSLSELETEFSFDKVGKAPAVFNYEKLDWYNKEWMKKLDIADLAKRAKPFFEAADGIDHVRLEETIFFEGVVKLGRERANTLQDIVENTKFLFADTLVYETELLQWRKSDLPDAKEKLNEIKEFLASFEDASWTEKGIEEMVMAWIKEHEYGVGDVLWPTRVALSGQQFSPGPFEIMAVLGKEKSLTRIGEGLHKLSS